MVYSMKSQSDFNERLHCFWKEIGIPVSRLMYGYMSQNNNKTNKICHRFVTTLRILEAGTPWANCTELYMGLFKEAIRRDLCITNVPMVLWDYWMKRWSWIHNAAPHSLFQKQEMNPHEATFGEQGGISNICNFGWYQRVYYITKN